jgi:hypothetical protein
MMKEVDTDQSVDCNTVWRLRDMAYYRAKWKKR